jgi:hypothetical protein
LDTLLSLADLVASGFLGHADVVRIVHSGSPMDFVVDLVARVRPHAGVASAPEPTPIEAAAPTRYWLASVVPDQAMSAEDFVEFVIVRRHVFGVGGAADLSRRVGVGDGIAFYLFGRGVVGRARIAALVADGGGLRDARRFQQVLRLTTLSLHLGDPVMLDPETELRLKAVLPAVSRHTAFLVEVSSESFGLLSPDPPAESAGGTGERGAEGDRSTPTDARDSGAA